MTITGTLNATLTARPQECSTSGNVHTIQISGSDSGGADVTLTVTDQKNYAQILSGGKLYFFKKGKLTVTAASAPLSAVVMPEDDGFGHGTVTVNGTIAC